MGNKPNDPNPSPKTPNNNNNIFKSLFTTTNHPSSPVSSIFSDSTPFRTQPTHQSQILQQLLQLDVDSPQFINTQTPISSINPPTKRKRQENPPINDLDFKKLKLQNDVVLGLSERFKIDDNDDGGDDNIRKSQDFSPTDGFDFKKIKTQNGVVSERLKKRKRGEVEAEYEGRKDGGVEMEMGEDEGVKMKIGGKRKEMGDKVELVSREGFDDEEKLLRTVFVGNLPLKVKKKALLKEFSRFGEVESVRIRSVPLLDDKTPRKGAVMKKQINDAVDRVNAYIVFKMEDSAQASLSHNMAVVGGNHIHVDRACPPRKKLKAENAPLYDTKRTVFIGNLPFDVKDEELYLLFTGFNNLKDCIEAIRVVRDPGTSMGKGIAYVLFTTREAANMVVRKHKLKIRDRELRLSHAMKTNTNSTPLKRKEPSTPDAYKSSKKAAVVGNTSYQGVQTTKSGCQKKFATRIAKPGRTESESEKAVKRKVRSDKRPAVAARKVAASTSRTSIDSGRNGAMKRKPENRTPQSISRSKKPRNI